MSLFARLQRFIPADLSRPLFACVMFVLALLQPATAAASSLPQFLVVDYHPVSKTLVQGGRPGAPLYDYVYRVDVRNGGAEVQDLSGTVRSRLPNITVQEPTARFGSVGKSQTKASVDTITVRAHRFFDRRLDKRMAVAGGWRYVDGGDDDDAGRIPGLAVGITVWTERLTALYYDLKFQFLFQWTFEVRTDTSAPVISAQAPQQLINDARPVISARYIQSGTGGVNTAGVVLLVDGTNVGSQAAIGADSISYRPASALSDGSHQVELSVPNKAGYTSKANWSFVVDTQAPTVSMRSPEGLKNGPVPTIGANFADTGSGIDSARVTLSVDRIDVTAQAVLAPAGIGYVPAKALADGTHSVSLTVTDLAGNRKTEEWSFGVDSRGLTISQQMPAQDSVLAADSLPRISAAFSGDGISAMTGKTVLTLDGANVTASATVSAGAIVYAAPTALAEGTHKVVLSVTDNRGIVSEAAWSFVTRTAPEIVATAPNDQLLGAQSPVRITASYRDIGAGIDLAATRLSMDGVDVTAQAQHDASGLVLGPAAALPQGLHVMTLTVADKAGNTAAATWRFTIDSGAPVVEGQAPKDTLVTSATPRITAAYKDSGELGTGIDPARIRLYVDNIDVTSAAQAGASGIAYTPAGLLAGGTHTVRLSVPDMAGNVTESVWSFTVDAEGPLVSASLMPAPDSVLPLDETPVISAAYSDSGSGVNASRVTLMLDGAAVTGLAQVSATGIRYTPAQALTEGPHAIVLTVVDNGGNTVDKAWNFTTRSAPQIDSVSPIEGSVLPAGAIVSVVASYHDLGSGIDPAAVRLLLDGSDVTGQASVAADSLRFDSPAGSLAPGVHSLGLRLADRAGNLAAKDVSFSIDVAATTIVSNQQPARNSVTMQGMPLVISASYADPSGIVPARVRIVLDDVDQTGSAQVGAAGFTLQAPALAPGRHVVYLSLVNAQGRESTAMWSFEVEAAGTYQVSFAEPDASRGFATPQAQVKVVASSDKAGVGEIVLNGKQMERGATEGRATTFSASVALVPGDNLLTAVARFADNRIREASLTLNYDVAPTVTIVAPADRSTLGPALASSPRDLTGNVERPVTISGTTSKPVASVTINQQQAVVSGSSWRFDNFFLHEGTNLVTVVATDAHGRVGTASATVSVDQTAPFLSIEAPLDNAVTSSNTVDVRGTVNDAVEGYYGASEPTVTIGGSKGSVSAVAADKQYLASNVPLEPGLNTLTVTAADQAGNVRTRQFRITRVAAGAPRLTVYGGNGQAAPAGSALAQPLTVAALDPAGQPIANAAVTFDITRGTGALALSQAGLSGEATPRNLQVRTDANGLASVWLLLGKQSGPGSNAVRASSPDIAEEANFAATGQKGPPQHIRPDLGINQYVATGTQPLEPLTAVVTDGQENRIANADVTFSVAAGEALFENGSDSITVKTDKNGFAAVRPTLGPLPGTTIVKATPAENGDAFFEATFTLQGLMAKDGPTRFGGVVMNDKGQPLPGARMSIGRTALSTTVDDKGRFSFEDIPPGKIDLFVDGRTVNIEGQQYPALHFEAAAVKGAQNQLPHPIYLPQLQMAEAKIVGGDQDVVLKMPGFEGYEMTVFANSVTFPDGSRTGPLVVSPISFDKLPMTPPGGFAGFMAPAATIQPSGTRFDPPVQLKIPNTAGLKPGEKKPVYQWDHDLATFVQMGQATVTEDAAFLVTDAGTGISKAGWHPIPNPPPPDDCPGSGGSPSCPQCQAVSSSGGKCPVKSCKPTSGGCDDKLYCTTGDTCVGGACRGTKIEDEKGPSNVYEWNLKSINSAFRVLREIGYDFEFAELKASVTMQEIKSCCESKQGAMVKGANGKIEGKMSGSLGPWPVAYRLPFPSAVVGRLGQLQAGLFLSAEYGVGVNGSVQSVPCAGTKACWGGGGNLFLDGTAELGVVIKDGPITAAKLTGALKTGIQAAISVDCGGGKLGGEWTGLTGMVVLEFSDGAFHLERNWVLYPAKPLGEITFGMPEVP